KAAKKALQGIAVVAVAIGIGLGLLANWAIALIAVLAFFAGIVVLVRMLVGKTGKLFKRMFPQLDEDGFRKKVLRQCETTRSLIGLTKQEIVDFDLDHKFLEEVDGELRK